MDDNNAIVVERQLGRRQYFWFLVSYSYSKWYVRVSILLAVAFVIFTSSTGNSILPWAVFVFLFLLFYSPFYALYTVRSRKNRKIFLPITYTFTNDEVTAEMPLGKDAVKWEIFNEWKRIGGFYVLIVTANSMVAIPEVDIPVQDKEKFITLLREKITDRS
jgi:hypothetical protein